MQSEWQLGVKKGKEHVGDWVWWRPDGTLLGRSSFGSDGKLHGVAQRYHSEGSSSMESRYVASVRWGKTRHTRSRRGDSPEDVHMAPFPAEVFEVALAYAAGNVVAQAACNERALESSGPC